MGELGAEYKLNSKSNRWLLEFLSFVMRSSMAPRLLGLLIFRAPRWLFSTAQFHSFIPQAATMNAGVQLKRLIGSLAVFFRLWPRARLCTVAT